MGTIFGDEGVEAMTLRWKLGDTVVDGGTFLPGKQLALEAYAPDPVPRTLQVYQVYSSAMRQILKHIGVPDRRPERPFAATLVEGQTYRADSLWRLQEPRGWRKSAAFVFVADDSDDASGRIYSSRVGVAQLGLEGGADLKDPTGTIPAPIGVSGKACISAGILFATDPTMSVEVLTGEALAEHMLRNLVDDVAPADDEDRADIAARVAFELPAVREALLRAYEPPPDWSMKPRQDVVEGDEGDRVSVALGLETPTPGSAYFAVSFIDPDDPDRAETTDAWGINVDVDLNVSAVRDPSGVALPFTAYA